MGDNAVSNEATSNSPEVSGNIEANLRSVTEIPSPYQNVFSQFRYFNVLQSNVLDQVFYTDDHIVVSAPTGSGKTVVFELAIVRLLANPQITGNDSSFKIIHLAPMKAMCEERLVDWHSRFKSVGLSCISVTGDSDFVDIKDLNYHNVIITTPEKWDSITRRWKDNQQLVQSIKLFLIDEVHLLNEDCRGSTLEAVVSRMKIIQDYISNTSRIRFLAVSATIPNIEDIAEWLRGGPNGKVQFFKFSEETRPVKLNKIVLGYPYNNSAGYSWFKFDIMLNYKLQSVMLNYAEGRPVLIFCNSRRSVEITAKHVTLNLTVQLTPEQQKTLQEAAAGVSDARMRGFLFAGVGCHHAGMLPENRRIVETLFRNGDLPVLVTTSTLAMGVNLPAHLVIIKSTKYYTGGECKDYSESAILQMIGRAGRPLFDTSAYAVIMTTTSDREKFEKMINGGHCVESNLHRNLNEHLNSEVVLHTITDLGIAMQWLTSTFLYVRARKNPKHYGLAPGLSAEQIDKKLLEMCQIEINKLARGGMLTIDENTNISPTCLGQLMARFYLFFDTMKLITQINGTEILPRLLGVISRCQEFSDMRLRISDKRPLNLLNSCKDNETIRFPLGDRIKTVEMKINCIIQAVFGNLPISEHSLITETEKIMRTGERISKCIAEYLSSQEFLQKHPRCYGALLSAVVLSKCFHAHLWENSPYLSRQLPGIGIVISRLLASAGKNTFAALLEANPRDLERIVNRKPPFGNTIQDFVRYLPKYQLLVEKVEENGNIVTVKLTANMTNAEDVKEQCSLDIKGFMVLLVGDSSNNILIYERYSHEYILVNQPIIKVFQTNKEQQSEIKTHFISDEWVGIDCEEKIVLSAKKIDLSVNISRIAETAKTKKPIAKKVQKSVSKNSSQRTKTNAHHVQTFMDRYMKKTKSFNKEKTSIQKKKSSSFGSIKTKSKTSKSNVNVSDNNAGPSSVNKTDEIPKIQSPAEVPTQNFGEKQIMDDSDEFIYNMSSESEELIEPEIHENSKSKTRENFESTGWKTFEDSSDKITDALLEICCDKNLESKAPSTSGLKNVSNLPNCQQINTSKRKLDESRNIQGNNTRNASSGFSDSFTESLQNESVDKSPIAPKNDATVTDSAIGSKSTSTQKLAKENETIPTWSTKSQSKTGYYHDKRNSSRKMPFPKLTFLQKNPKQNWSSASNDDQESISFNEKQSKLEETKTFPDSTSQSNFERFETPEKRFKNAEENHKSISWRSPLVFSPAVKYSPHLTCLQKQAAQKGNQLRHSQLSRQALFPKQPQTAPSKAPSRSNTKTVLPTIPLSDRDYMLQNSGVVLETQPLSAKNPQEQPDQFPPPGANRIPESLYDFCSDSLIDILQYDPSEKLDDSGALRRSEREVKVKEMDAVLYCLMSQQPSKPKQATSMDDSSNGTPKNFCEFVKQFNKPEKTRKAVKTSTQTSLSVPSQLNYPQGSQTRKETLVSPIKYRLNYPQEAEKSRFTYPQIPPIDKPTRNFHQEMQVPSKNPRSHYPQEMQASPFTPRSHYSRGIQDSPINSRENYWKEMPASTITSCLNYTQEMEIPPVKPQSNYFQEIHIPPLQISPVEQRLNYPREVEIPPVKPRLSIPPFNSGLNYSQEINSCSNINPRLLYPRENSNIRSKWYEYCRENNPDEFDHESVNELPFDWQEKENVPLNESFQRSYSGCRKMMAAEPMPRPLQAPPSQTFERHWSNESVIDAEHAPPSLCRERSDIPPLYPGYEPRNYRGVSPSFNRYYRQPLQDIPSTSYQNESYGYPAPFPGTFVRRYASQNVSDEAGCVTDGNRNPELVRMSRNRDGDSQYMMRRFLEDLEQEEENFSYLG